MGVRREGKRLLAEVTGQLSVELLPESATNFFIKLTGRSVAFVQDAEGKVKSVNSNVNGVTGTFVKVSDQPPERPVPPKPPIFVTVAEKALEAFVGRYKYASGMIMSIARAQDHLVMLPERRGGLDLYPESENKASCPYFLFEVTLLKDRKGEIVGLITSCPEPDFTGKASRITPRIQGAWINNSRTVGGIVVGVGILLLLALVFRRNGRRRLNRDGRQQGHT
jgi:hypothetical protein